VFEEALVTTEKVDVKSIVLNCTITENSLTKTNSTPIKLT